MITYRYVLLGAASAVIIAGAYAARSIAAAVAGADTPAGSALMAHLRSARDGEVITLENKDYGVVIFPQVDHAKPVRIKAAAARFTGVVLKQVSGITIDGGTIVGPGGRSYGISINGSSNVTISGMTITGAHRGVVLNKSHDIALLDNTLTGLLSDGIDIALSRKVVVRGNSCSNFSPTMDSYDATGKLIKGGGDHPDCIQAWSRPEVPPTSDLTIERNRIEGKMQGIFLGNHVRDGVDDGGFDRIVIRDNVVKVSLYNGIAAGSLRDAVVTGNTVSTLPGGFNPKYPTKPIRAWLHVSGERVVACGNTVTDFPRDPPNMRCKPDLTRP